MQYFGGKARLGKKIAQVIQEKAGDIKVYIEPFCGVCSVGQYIKAEKKIFSDANQGLISLLNSFFKGGLDLPDNVDEQTYKEANNRVKKGSLDPVDVFISIACSFMGRQCEGFARNKGGRNYALAGKRSLTKKKPQLEEAFFFYRDYSFYKEAEGCVFYMDPPYANTAGYLVGVFDNTVFWQFCRDLSKKNLVFISEYSAPEDFIPVAVFEHTRGARSIETGSLVNKKVGEKVFMYKNIVLA